MPRVKDIPRSQRDVSAEAEAAVRNLRWIPVAFRLPPLQTRCGGFFLSAICGTFAGGWWLSRRQGRWSVVEAWWRRSGRVVGRVK